MLSGVGLEPNVLNVTALPNGIPLGMLVKAGFGCHDGFRAAQVIRVVGYLDDGCLFGQIGT